MTSQAKSVIHFSTGSGTSPKTVVRVVRNLALFNGAIIVLLVAYAHARKMPIGEIIPLVLTAVLASIPVALPATFTLAAALGAKALARLGVLPTRLSAVDEAATLDVLCSDKTGTLTRNELAVTAIRPEPGFDEARVLAMAALASSDGGQDPVDAAIRSAATKKSTADLPKLTKFVPFDPATKMSEATAVDANGGTLRAVKGAFAAVIKLTEPVPTAAATARELEEKGFRVLAVAVGTPTTMRLAGIIALSDPPRTDAAELIKELHTLGVRTVMVTGDARRRRRRSSRERWDWMELSVRPDQSRRVYVQKTSRSLPEFFRRISITSFRRSRRAAIPSACAAMAPMMRQHCARRRWELRFRLRRTSPSRRPESC